ncbi:mraZ family protein [Bacteroides fragilis str. 3986 N3]|nr:mraZ family protein [Bacteroides fragilis str. 3783N1-2]EXY62188.1 mraZ family protein [Bacteroides fragilis str. 3986T(B)10]EXZ70111.1 mraZ family protein [Bacteroides fragilis str. 3783N1-8]EYA02085.1 mraZ family protein [Bacteroides fragilis str. S23 R14]EYA41244.1 mraZ family protein [Bacteroides fragilis str. 20793-3]EYA59092.1 mraZ family protein [Bacteroides fragilis str. 3986 T(B)13]EYA68383.1 mraZ family protein [Bacteroides fragilis str. S23L24]EYB11678.1 mraZ family protein [Ba
MRKDVFQDCLVLYPEEVWNEELDELRQRLNKWNANHQLIFRQFVSDVEIITMDGNGRILIPKRYLQITGIQSDVRFIGVDNKIEIWAKERAEKLFMEPKAFGAALEEIMKEERRTTNNELK